MNEECRCPSALREIIARHGVTRPRVFGGAVGCRGFVDGGRRPIWESPFESPIHGVLTCLHRLTSAIRMSTTLTIRLDEEVKDRLDRLADSTQRSKSYLAAEAIREFVERNEWQVAQTRAALHEADAGDFATDDEVAALARKWQAGGTGNAR